MKQQLTAIIEREGDGYVALCPQLDIASEGDSIETAGQNLREALELFFETASKSEIVYRSDLKNIYPPPARGRDRVGVI
ncbi:MAG: type II toxin-antitoxin system HicB family antitoxin [Gammaproteobacteria bacterium]